MYQSTNSKTKDSNSVWRGLFAIVLIAVCFGHAPAARAVVPAPDGAYAGFNTAEGQNALLHLAGGVWNTALGGQALLNDTTGTGNTAVGLNALYHNTDGDSNTAVGVNALLFNSTAFRNVAVGYAALGRNTTAFGNVAVGFQALGANTGTSAFGNVAVGYQALVNSTTSGNSSNALGYQALARQTIGSFNNGFGWQTLFDNQTGNFNTAMGDGAGANITGSGNVCIGAGVPGLAGESNVTRIRNIYSAVASQRVVYADSDNKIGTLASSRRYKEEIKPMDKASESILALRPVTFRYKHEFDATRAPMFGLVAEDVERINPDLVIHNEKGEPESVRYDAIDAMLLNEFLKAHDQMQRLAATVAKQEQEIKSLVASLKEQRAQNQMDDTQGQWQGSTPQVVANQ